MITTQAVILAAGRGSRLGPYSENSPKGLVRFANRPLIDWQIAALHTHGISRIGIVCGYLKEKFRDLGIHLWENSNWARTNMVASLLCAEDWLRRDVDTIVAYGDIIYEPRVLAALLATPGDVVTVIDRDWLELWRVRSDAPLSDAETLRLNQDGHIVDIGRRAQSLEEIQGQYIGLTKFSPGGALRFVDLCRDLSAPSQWFPVGGMDKAYMTDALRGLIESGQPVTAAPVDGGWLEFDTARDLDSYHALLAGRSLNKFFEPWLEV